MPNTTHRSHSHYTGIYPGNLFMVVAPSGAGKSTLVNALLAEDRDILLSVSYTTREARSKETNGVQYHFVSVDEFMERREKGEFAPYPSIEEALAYPYTEQDRTIIARSHRRGIFGDPATCKAKLVDLANRYGVNELVILTITHDPAARRRSYELLADAFQLVG